MPHLKAVSIADADSWAMLADAVERYEQRLREPDPPDLGEFLLDERHTLYTRVAAELIRVDLERSWELEEPKSLEDYRRRVPRLFEDPAALAEVAFEDYRLRRLSGDTVTCEEYSSRYGVSTDSWPNVDSRNASRVDELRSPRPVRMPEPGESFAGFRIGRVIGRGAFATAFWAEQNDLAQRPVVLKVSKRRSLEPEHLARLQHTNIVPIYSVHESAGLVGVCMPYCGDRTLADVLAKGLGSIANQSTVARADEETLRNPSDSFAPEQEEVKEQPEAPCLRRGLDANEAVRIVRDLAQGLAHAHERGVVHRDLKPANVLMADDGRPMLLDFNLSEGAVVDGVASLTVGGTLPYMAPEHFEAVQLGGAVGPECDVYSLGVILYELLTGERPFPDRRGQLDTVIAESLRDRAAGPRPPRRLERGVPPAVESLVLKCLAPVAQRYASATDLADDLQRHLDNLPLKHAANPSLAERARKWRRRHPRLTSAGAVGALAAVLVTLLAALGVSRTHQVARFEADAIFRRFQRDMAPVRTLLSVPNTDLELLRDGHETGSRVLDTVADSIDGDWHVDPRADRLDARRRREVDNDIAELAYLLARAEGLLAGADAETTAPPLGWSKALALNEFARTALPGISPALIQQQAEFEDALGINPSPSASVSAHVDPPLIDNLFNAQLLLEEHEFESAIIDLYSFCEGAPTDPVAWLLLGNAYAGAGELADAEAALSLAVSLQPHSYVAIYNRGLCRLQRGKHADAIADFTEVLAMRPTLVCARLNRAIAHEAEGDDKAALVDLDAALATGRSPSRAYLLRARVRERIGDATGAKEDLSLGLSAEPTDEAGWVARGVARLPDDPEGAQDDFRESLRRFPTSTLALKNLVHVNADRLQRNDDALAALDAWLALEPKNPSALVGRAVLHAREGRREDCLRDLKALGDTADPLIAFQSACALSLTADNRNSDMQQALDHLSDALVRDPTLVARAATDPDLEALRVTNSYRELVAAYRDLALVRRRLAIAANGDPH